jgi:hypothetical protein
MGDKMAGNIRSMPWTSLGDKGFRGVALPDFVARPVFALINRAVSPVTGDFAVAEPGRCFGAHLVCREPGRRSHPVAYSYLDLTHLMPGEPIETISLHQQAINISPRDPRMSRFQR